MAYRDKTREFLRRRGARSSHDHNLSGDQDSLLPNGDDGQHATSISLPPEWVDDLDLAREEMEQLKAKMRDLQKMHDEHLNRPNFDEEAEEERRIEIATSNLTSMFHRCQKTIQSIARKGRAAASTQEHRMAQNVVKSIAFELQTLSKDFRSAQGTYLKKIRAREEKSKNYGFSSEMEAAGVDDDDDDDNLNFDTGFTDQQHAQVQDSSRVIKEREEAITSVVQSISELSTIFRDLADLVVEQGTILDRIDYNLELTETRIEQGRKELEKGNKYHKSASKKYIIILLILVVVSLFFALIAKKKFGGGHHTPAATTTTVMPTT